MTTLQRLAKSSPEEQEVNDVDGSITVEIKIQIWIWTEKLVTEFEEVKYVHAPVTVNVSKETKELIGGIAAAGSVPVAVEEITYCVGNGVEDRDGIFTVRK